MRERLPRHIIDLLISMGETGDQLGYSVYAIGGFIRDIFIMQENLDIDVVVEGDGIKFAEAFAKEHPGVRARYHSKFNTAVLIFPDGFKVDIATARLEYYESPAALPVVEAGSLRNDLYRRDFTINSLAVKLNPDNFGILLDFFRGISDIKLGYIRVLHNLSFVEDPTRVFRAIRFEQRFGFKIGKLTASLIHNAVKHDFFQKLSGRRLFGELKLILSEGDPVPAIKRLAEFDLLKFIYPTLKLDSKKEKLLKNINKVRDWLDLTYLDESYQPWLVYLLGLIDGLDPEDVVKLSQKLSLKQIHRQAAIDQMPEVHKVTGLLYRSGNLKPGNLFNLLKPLSTEAILLLMAKTPRAGIKKAISGYFTKLKSVKTELSGKYLIDLGLEPGPQFKFILDSLLEARLNGQVSNLEQEKSFVDEQVKALIQ